MSNFKAKELRHIHLDLPIWNKHLRPTIFIETGTLDGDTSLLAAIYYDEVFSIELSKDLNQKAQERFGGGRIHFIQGDSGVVLVDLLQRSSIKSNGIFFYLDAHFFSKGAKGKAIAKESPFPLWVELGIISEKGGAVDVVVVDDVHCFGGNRPDERWKVVSPDTILSHLLPREILFSEIIGDQFVVVVK